MHYIAFIIHLHIMLCCSGCVCNNFTFCVTRYVENLVKVIFLTLCAPRGAYIVVVRHMRHTLSSISVMFHFSFLVCQSAFLVPKTDANQLNVLLWMYKFRFPTPDVWIFTFFNSCCLFSITCTSPIRLGLGLWSILPHFAAAQTV